MIKLNSFLSSIPFLQQKQQKKIEKASEEVRVYAEEELARARHEAADLKKKAEVDIQRSKQEITEIERRLKDKENEVYRLKEKLEKEGNKIAEEKQEVQQRKEEILKKLEKAARLDQAEAREIILKGWEEKLKADIAKRIKHAEEKIKEEADEKAKEILVDAMRHGSTDYIAEFTLSTISLPDDSFKGRIIGKEGRNIRAFELATGVDVDLEEEGVIKISSFDALKREVAKVAMERLIKDGRVQPVRIEEIVKETQEHIERVMFEAGTDLAHEVKADVMTVKLGCLFHDIGKVVEGKEGSHVDLGVEVLKKHGFPEAVIHCVAASHEDIPFKSKEAIIVYISDGVSGGRPGARHEDFDQYLKRIKDIEDIATTNKGVKEAYALQAGRELRVIVSPEEVSEEAAVVLAQNIKENIEKKFPVFPGQVTITIIRETRAVATSHS